MYMSTHYIQNIVPKKCAFDMRKCALQTTSVILKQRVVMSMLLGCNVTAICAVSSFGELCSQNSWVSRMFYHSPILVHR